MRLTMTLLGVLVVVGLGLLGRRVGGDRVGLIAAGLGGCLRRALGERRPAHVGDAGRTRHRRRPARRATASTTAPAPAGAALFGVVGGLAGLARAELVLLLPAGRAWSSLAAATRAAIRRRRAARRRARALVTGRAVGGLEPGPLRAARAALQQRRSHLDRRQLSTTPTTRRPSASGSCSAPSTDPWRATGRRCRTPGGPRRSPTSATTSAGSRRWWPPAWGARSVSSRFARWCTSTATRVERPGCRGWPCTSTGSCATLAAGGAVDRAPAWAVRRAAGRPGGRGGGDHRHLLRPGPVPGPGRRRRRRPRRGHARCGLHGPGLPGPMRRAGPRRRLRTRCPSDARPDPSW